VAAAGFTAAAAGGAAAAGSWCGADPSEAACTRKLRERREKREKLSEKTNGEEREKVEDKREESKGNNAAETGKVKEGEKEEGVGSILISSEGAKGDPSAHLQRPGKTIRIPKSRRKVKFLCWSFQNYAQYSTCAPSPSSLASSASTITQPSDSGFGQLAIAVSKAARSTSLGNAAESE
jgi:hypothetical protein